MTCLRVSGSVKAGTPPVKVLERCDSSGDVVSGCVVVFVVALCVHPLQLESSPMILSESSDGLGYSVSQKSPRLVKLL